MSRITYQQAAEIVGEGIINWLMMMQSFEMTNRLTNDGSVEMSASHPATTFDDKEVILSMYVYFDAEAFADVDDLSSLNWEAAKSSADFEIV